MAKTQTKRNNKKPVVTDTKQEVTKETETQEIFGLDKNSPMFQELPKVKTSKLNGSWGAKK